MEDSEQQFQRGLQKRESKSEKIEEAINRMNQLHAVLTSTPPPHNSLEHLKQYITLYVENHRDNEQVFTTLCEHQILSLIFGFRDPSKNIYYKPLCLQSLQIFNLLLANSNTPLQLGYLLSQSSLHQGLFVNALAVTDPQFIEYYSQILKSITMKLSQKENSSLLKVFYNSKYPSFPLMLNCTFLANTYAEQLVKVTSRQCVLVLVNLLKEKGMHGYLSQLPMLIFYARLIWQERKHITDLGDIGYIGDLFWAIKQNNVAVFALGNAICNLVILENIKRPAAVLGFVKNIMLVVKGHADASTFMKAECRQWARRVETTFMNILAKFLFKKFLHSQYLAAFLQVNSSLSSRNISMYPSNMSNKYLIRKIDQSCNKTFSQLEKTFRSRSQIEPTQYAELSPSSSLVLYCQKIQNHYASDREFLKMKQSYAKGQKRSPSRKKSFLNSMMEKMSDDYILTNFLSSLSQVIGFKVSLGKYLKRNSIEKAIQSPNWTIFTSQFCTVCVDEDSKSSQYKKYDQIHLNQVRKEWTLNGDFLNAILNMIMENKRLSTDMDEKKLIRESQIRLSMRTSISSNLSEEASGTQIFEDYFKQYLQQTVPAHIDKDKLSPKSLILLQRTCQLLRVSISQNQIYILINKLKSLHSQIQAYLFQNGFSQATQFILHPENQVNNNSILIQKLVEYDIIHQISRNMKRKHISLLQTYQQHLRSIEFPEQSVFFEVCYYGSQNCKMTVTLNKEPAILVQISLHGKNMFQTDLLNLENKVRINGTNPAIIHFGENLEAVNMNTEKNSRVFMQKIKQFRFTIDQTVTMAVIKYLERTMDQVKTLDPRNQVRSKPLILSRRSSGFTTPHQ